MIARSLVLLAVSRAHPLSLLLAILTTGCAKAHLVGFGDPAFAGRSFGKLAVVALGMTLEATVAMEDQLCGTIGRANCQGATRILPPTRRLAPNEVADRLASAGVDGVLVVVLLSDKTTSQHLGTITTATEAGATTVNLYRDWGSWAAIVAGSAASRSVSTPLYGMSRRAIAAVGLFDRSSGDLAWRGELRVEGQGQGVTSDKSFMAAASKRIASELRSVGFVP